jgi:hypothetical protein
MGGEGKEVNKYHRPDHLWCKDELISFYQQINQ